MRSKTPKLLHEVCGRPMISWVVAAARAAGASKIVVVDAPGEPLKRARRRRRPASSSSRRSEPAMPAGCAGAHRARRDGRRARRRRAADHRATRSPSLARAQRETGAAATILTAVFEDPTGYGRVVRAADGSVEKIVETKGPGDATPEELKIKEINSRALRVLRRGAAAGARAGRQRQRPGRVLPAGRAAARCAAQGTW